MLEEQDEELNALLNKYKVENSNTELLDRIVNQAQSRSQKKNRRNWVRNALLFVALAIISFGIGFFSAPDSITKTTATITEPVQAIKVSTDTSNTKAISSDTISLDTFLLGPNSFEEVML